MIELTFDDEKATQFWVISKLLLTFINNYDQKLNKMKSKSIFG